jgi:hypothetical protein
VKARDGTRSLEREDEIMGVDTPVGHVHIADIASHLRDLRGDGSASWLATSRFWRPSPSGA